MHDESLALVFASVGVVGLFCQWLAWRLRLPAILFLLLAGIIALAVAVILFEGSLTLNFKEIRGVSNTVWSIVSIGAVISWAQDGKTKYKVVEHTALGGHSDRPSRRIVCRDGV